jgi:iron complex transport system substrate-binding protein
MRRIAAFAIAASVAAGAQALQIKDDRGTELSLEAPAARIATLAPHLAEIAFAAGAGAKLVGVSTFSRHPPEAERLPVVASYGRVDVERLIALRPALVLAWQSGNSPLQLERLERLGIPVFVTETRSLADIPRVVRLVGALAGSTESAEAYARQLEREIGDLRRRHAGERSIAVFLEIWHAPMLTVSGGHLASDALRLCGARNVFAGAKALTPLVSREQLLAARPDAIITAGAAAGAPGAWRGFELLEAVRRGRVYSIDPDALYGQGPRFLLGVRALCGRLELLRN